MSESASPEQAILLEHTLAKRTLPSLGALRVIHQRLSDPSKPSRGYAMDTRLLVAPDYRALDLDAVAEAVVCACPHKQAVRVVTDLINDQAWLAFNYELVRREAHETALAALCTIYERDLQGAWPVNPCAEDGLLRMDADGRLAAYVDSELRGVAAALESHPDGHTLAGATTVSIGSLLTAIETAFGAAKGCLVSMNPHRALADLMHVEVLTELATR